jgi:hypothetical protein
VAPARGQRAWPTLESALGRDGERVLAVLPIEVLRATVARALALPHERAVALRVDPGRLVLLRVTASGFALRRSNVRAPDTSPGTALPDGAAGSAR